MDKTARVSISVFVASSISVAVIALSRSYPSAALFLLGGALVGCALVGAAFFFLLWYSWALSDTAAIERAREEQRRTRFR
jgi:uncharacterized protein involved in exopolysaccharide biosynthesis